MGFDSFEDFVGELDRRGELIRISEQVATELEITELSEREMLETGGGKALLFEKPTINGKVSPFPVAINTMGSEERMAMILGKNSVDEASEELGSLMKAKPPMNAKEAIKLASTAINLRHTKPKSVKTGPCKEVIIKGERLKKLGDDSSQDPTLLDIPILKCWPEDGGRFMTLPCVVTKDPDTGDTNLGMYRIQVLDKQKTGMHWQLQKVAARHGKRYYETGTKMPVAIFLGGDPAYAFSATAPLPDGLNEFLMAGFLRKKAVPMVKCETIDLEVPANADFVFEGYVDPSEELIDEGPFGDHTGFYTPIDKYPAFHITAITHRKNAIYPATIVGRPPKEDFYMGSASVKLFMPIFQMNFPEIVDIALPAEGVFHNLVFVSIRKTYPYQAYKIMYGLWGMGQMMFTKYIVVVDAEVDVHNTSEVLFHWMANTDPSRDRIETKGPTDVLDHASPSVGIGSKMGFDATSKLPSEGHPRDWPSILSMPDHVRKKVDPIWQRMKA